MREMSRDPPGTGLSGCQRQSSRPALVSDQRQTRPLCLAGVRTRPAGELSLAGMGIRNPGEVRRTRRKSNRAIVLNIAHLHFARQVGERKANAYLRSLALTRQPPSRSISICRGSAVPVRFTGSALP